MGYIFSLENRHYHNFVIEQPMWPPIGSDNTNYNNSHIKRYEKGYLLFLFSKKERGGQRVRKMNDLIVFIF